MRGLSAASLVRARRLVHWGSFGSFTTWGSAVRTDEESPCFPGMQRVARSVWIADPGGSTGRRRQWSQPPCAALVEGSGWGGRQPLDAMTKGYHAEGGSSF